MLLCLERDQDIDFLKWEASVLTKDQKFPHAAAEKLKEILMDDKIQAKEFSEEFNKILSSTENLSWKTLVYLGNIKDRFIDEITNVSWGPIGIIGIILILIFFISKKFKLKKPLRIVSSLSATLLERFIALLGYFVTLVVVYSSYIPTLLPSYPYLNFITPTFMKVAMTYYVQYASYIQYIYFFGVVILCIQFKFPRPRFIRFHMIRGIMLLAFQGIPDSIFSLLQSSDSLNPSQQINGALLLFVINLFWILPCLVQAITHTYPRSSFIRDAIEIQLGRDKDEDFKWWDRQ